MKRLKMLVCFVICVLLCTGCSAKPPATDSKLISFYYMYGAASVNQSYDVAEASGSVQCKASSFVSGTFEYKIDTQVNRAVLDDLQALAAKYNLYKWNYFDKMSEVPDGINFALTLVYDDGTTISAKGGEKFPKDFETAHAALLEYLDAMAKDLCAQGECAQ